MPQTSRRSLGFATVMAIFVVLTSGTMATAGNFYLGLELASSHLGEADLSEAEIAAGAVAVDEVGGGGGGYLGYEFSPSFSLRLRVDGTSHDSSHEGTEFRIISSALEGVYKFSPDGPLSPCIFGGFGASVIEARDDPLEADTSGPSVALGIGMFYMLGEHVGLDFSCTGTFINWEEQTARVTLPDGSVIEGTTSIDDSGATIRFCLGIGYWF